MSIKKLLAAVGLASALLVGATNDASANPWRGPHFQPVPVYRPIVRAPLYAPVYRASVVYGPAYVPAYPAPVVYQTPVYVPAYHPVGWRHRAWVRVPGHRW